MSNSYGVSCSTSPVSSRVTLIVSLLLFCGFVDTISIGIAFSSVIVVFADSESVGEGDADVEVVAVEFVDVVAEVGSEAIISIVSSGTFVVVLFCVEVEYLLCTLVVYLHLFTCSGEEGRVRGEEDAALK